MVSECLWVGTRQVWMKVKEKQSMVVTVWWLWTSWLRILSVLNTCSSAFDCLKICVTSYPEENPSSLSWQSAFSD